MAVCEVCGNDYGTSFEVITSDGVGHIFDSFECAIHTMAPACAHCGCRIIGHGVEGSGKMFCGARCAEGSTITIFPIDDQTLRYLRFTGRPHDVVARVEAYAKEQGLWHEADAEPSFSEVLDLDGGEVERVGRYVPDGRRGEDRGRFPSHKPIGLRDRSLTERRAWGRAGGGLPL